MSIKNWPKDDRPREKLLKNGEHTLSNSELLAILLRTGVKGQSAIDLSRKILHKFKTFRNMSHTDLSIWKEFGPLLEKELGQPIPVSRQAWRPGDQRVFIADVSKAKRDFGWVPKINVETGIRKLFDWVRANQDLF